MKSLLIVCIICFIGFFLNGVFALHLPQNLIGSFLGYGGCPNCKDNWWWKKSGSIPYGELKEGKDYHLSGDTSSILDIRVSSGVIICEECLQHSERLNPQKIKADLIKYGWEEEKADLVFKAVVKYKAEKTKITT